MNDRVTQDSIVIGDLAVFLAQDRNGLHLSDLDLEKAKQALRVIKDKLKKYGVK